MVKVGNIYSNIPEKLPEEIFDEILKGKNFKLERIISRGQATPPGEWYDQDRDEWVLLLQGSAGILIDGDTEAVTLRPGDHILLPAQCKHRVEWTASDSETIWLALHMNLGKDQE